LGELGVCPINYNHEGCEIIHSLSAVRTH